LIDEKIKEELNNSLSVNSWDDSVNIWTKLCSGYFL
jgi:hypothetical protein